MARSRKRGAAKKPPVTRAAPPQAPVGDDLGTPAADGDPGGVAPAKRWFRWSPAQLAVGVPLGILTLFGVLAGVGSFVNDVFFSDDDPSSDVSVVNSVVTDHYEGSAQVVDGDVTAPSAMPDAVTAASEGRSSVLEVVVLNKGDLAALFTKVEIRIRHSEHLTCSSSGGPVSVSLYADVHLPDNPPDGTVITQDLPTQWQVEPHLHDKIGLVMGGSTVRRIYNADVTLIDSAGVRYDVGNVTFLSPLPQNVREEVAQWLVGGDEWRPSIDECRQRVRALTRHAKGNPGFGPGLAELDAVVKDGIDSCTIDGVAVTVVGDQKCSGLSGAVGQVRTVAATMSPTDMTAHPPWQTTTAGPWTCSINPDVGARHFAYCLNGDETEGFNLTHG